MPLQPLMHAVVAAVCAAAVVPARAGEVLDRIQQRGKIVIAHREASVPFSYLDGNGRPIGYAIELCHKLADAIAEKLKLRHLAIDYLLVTSATRIASVAEGRADLACDSTTNNAERRRKVAFTVPHYITGARYVVRATSPIQQLVDFEGKTLLSTTGTTPLKALQQANRERLLRIRIGEVDDHVRGVEAVENGTADGFAMDEVLLYGLIATRPDPSKLKVVGKYLTIEPLGIMYSRDDAELKRIVDDEMKRLIRSREAYAIHDRWFTQPIPPSGRNLNLPMNYLLRDFWKYPTDRVPD